MSKRLDISDILRSYPRERPPLTPRHRACYVEEYLRNRAGSGPLTSVKMKLESWMHLQVARVQRDGPVLELGAGTLNHLAFEPSSSEYDVVEPFESLWRDSPHIHRVRRLYAAIDEAPTARAYARIFSIAVLEHLTDLPVVVAMCGLRLQPDGIFQAGIPTEAGFLWGAAWRTTTGPAYRLRTGLPYAAIMRHEHVNSASEIARVLKYFFERVLTRRFPLPYYHASFYTYLEASGPRLDRCEAFRLARTESVESPPKDA